MFINNMHLASGELSIHCQKHRTKTPFFVYRYKNTLGALQLKSFMDRFFRDPAKRLGHPKSGFAIRDHEFFKDKTWWEDIFNKKILPPIIPVRFFSFISS